MPKNKQDEKMLKEIDNELDKIHKLFEEYHSWKDKETQKVWFPPGRYFNYDKLVEREYGLLAERKSIVERANIKSA